MTSEDAVPERPGWLILSAWCAFLCTVPSAVWRVAMIMGWLPDTSELRDRELEQGTISGYLYVYALSIVQLGFGFLTAGLVRPWGERIRGWRIPRIIPTLLGLLGGLAATWIFNIAMVSAIAFGHRPDWGTLSGWPLVIMVWCSGAHSRCCRRAATGGLVDHRDPSRPELHGQNRKAQSIED